MNCACVVGEPVERTGRTDQRKAQNLDTLKPHVLLALGTFAAQFRYMGHLEGSAESRRRFVVYCDESRDSLSDRTGYLGIGGLWIEERFRDGARTALKAAAHEHGVNGEMKWSKVSRQTIAGYAAVVDQFFSLPAYFRILLARKSDIDPDRFHEGSAELGFYKFYYTMLEKWVWPSREYVILLDHKSNAAPGRHVELRRVLGNAKHSHECIRQLAFIDSKQSHLSQLVDVLTGAVTRAWGDEESKGSKHELQQHIARHLGRSSLRFSSASPEFGKFNVFQIELDIARGRSRG